MSNYVEPIFVKKLHKLIHNLLNNTYYFKDLNENLHKKTRDSEKNYYLKIYFNFK